MQGDHDGKRHQEGHRVQYRIGDPQHACGTLQKVRDCRLADPAEQYRADGDTQLGAGQHQ